jgi:hypothetical protein
VITKVGHRAVAVTVSLLLIAALVGAAFLGLRLF